MCRGRIERVVRAGLRTRLAADAAVVVEIDNPVWSRIERGDRTDLHAGCGGAVVTALNGEQAASVRIDTFLDVLDPGAVHTQRHVVLGLTRHGAGMTADALAVINDEAVVHGNSEEGLGAGG